MALVAAPIALSPDTAASSRAAYQAVSFIYDQIARIQNWIELRKTLNLLDGLSDHELNDIGLTRGQINEIARKGAFN